MARLSLLLVTAGVILVAGSLAWPYLIGGRGAWTEADAEQHAETMLRLHKLTYQHGHGDNHAQTPDAQPMQALQERYQQGREALASARSRGQGTAVVCRWLGIALTLAGGIALFATRHQS